MWLDNFTETENSDNRCKKLKLREPLFIVIGGTSIQRIRVPFLYSEYAKSIQVLYKQGLTSINVGGEGGLFVTADNVKEDIEHHCSVITVTLTPSQTRMFKDTLLDTYVQLKIETKEGAIVYDIPRYVYVKAPLDLGENGDEPTPPPTPVEELIKFQINQKITALQFDINAVPDLSKMPVADNPLTGGVLYANSPEDEGADNHFISLGCTDIPETDNGKALYIVDYKGTLDTNLYGGVYVVYSNVSTQIDGIEVQEGWNLNLLDEDGIYNPHQSYTVDSIEEPEVWNGLFVGAITTESYLEGMTKLKLGQTISGLNFNGVVYGKPDAAMNQFLKSLPYTDYNGLRVKACPIIKFNDNSDSNKEIQLFAVKGEMDIEGHRILVWGSWTNGEKDSNDVYVYADSTDSESPVVNGWLIDSNKMRLPRFEELRIKYLIDIDIPWNGILIGAGEYPIASPRLEEIKENDILEGFKFNINETPDLSGFPLDDDGRCVLCYGKNSWTGEISTLLDVRALNTINASLSGRALVLFDDMVVYSDEPFEGEPAGWYEEIKSFSGIFRFADSGIREMEVIKVFSNPNWNGKIVGSILLNENKGTQITEISLTKYNLQPRDGVTYFMRSTTVGMPLRDSNNKLLKNSFYVADIEINGVNYKAIRFLWTPQHDIYYDNLSAEVNLENGSDISISIIPYAEELNITEEGIDIVDSSTSAYIVAITGEQGALDSVIIKDFTPVDLPNINPVDINLDDVTTLEVNGYTQYDNMVKVRFTPTETNDYVLNLNSDHPSQCYLYSSDGERLYDKDSNWDSEKNKYNIKLSYKLNAGETYTYAVRFYDTIQTGEMTLTLNLNKEIVDLPKFVMNTPINGYQINMSGLTPTELENFLNNAEVNNPLVSLSDSKYITVFPGDSEGISSDVRILRIQGDNEWIGYFTSDFTVNNNGQYRKGWYHIHGDHLNSDAPISSTSNSGIRDLRFDSSATIEYISSTFEEYNGVLIGIIPFVIVNPVDGT